MPLSSLLQESKDLPNPWPFMEYVNVFAIQERSQEVKGGAPKVARVEFRVFVTNEIKMPAVSSMLAV